MNYSKNQLFFLSALRIAIGWHIFYEGLVKYMSDGWSAKGYLMSAEGWFAGIFKILGSNDSILSVVDFLNIYGQLAIGLGLILGLYARYGQIAAAIMLGLFYLAHPAFGSESMGIGNYLIVDRNIIELLAVCVLILYPTSQFIGIDRFISKKRS